MNFTRHLLVDGANLLHAWPELRAMLPHQRPAARALLARRVGVIHDVEEMRVTLVFDGRGPELALERPSDEPTFSVLHTPSALTADDVIEQLVGSPNSEPARCIVATGDRAERQTVETLGARAISPEELAAWVERASARQGSRVSAWRRAQQGGAPDAGSPPQPPTDGSKGASAAPDGPDGR